MMLDCRAFYEAMTEQGFDFYAGVPDSLLKDFCAYLTDYTAADRHIITANEGSAIALAAGHFLATGKPGVVYMQNSGLGNTVNPLTSLADPACYGIPMLLVIGWRGEPGKKDEPQHVKMGAVTRELLDAVGVAYTVLPDNIEEAHAAVADAVVKMNANQAPHALLIRKGTFDKHVLQSGLPSAYEMTREAAIRAVVERLDSDALVVATTGKPSRELFEIREQRSEPHDTDFLTVGSMGHSSQIALGVALRHPNREVFCLDGDGAALMHLGGFATIGTSGAKNYRHVIVNNGAHDSVGGQPTVGFEVSLTGVALACGYKAAFVATSAEEVAAHWDAFMGTEGPVVLEIRVKTGARADLGRPTMTPKDLKKAFMGAIRG
ncbi:MAG: phosphonopyruvate decarboxylase [Myxococcota bacterium]|jgi:phosphonopyruvate decarboxylase